MLDGTLRLVLIDDDELVVVPIVLDGFDTGGLVDVADNGREFFLVLRLEAKPERDDRNSGVCLVVKGRA